MTASAVATGVSAVTDRERSLLDTIAETSHTENAASARLIAQIMDYTNSRGTFEHRAPGAGFDTEQAERSAIAEVALALSSTFKSVSSLMRLGFTLERMPEVRDAFTAGEVSLAKIRVIDERTRKATTAAALRLDTDIATAAIRLAAGPLGVEIERLLIEDDATWAQRARKDAEGTRKVRSRRLPHGMGVLSVTLTATQLTAITGLIVKVAKTVCRADPRTLDVRCADAFVVLMHGGRTLTCECGDEKCAATRNREPAAPQVNLSISCGLETLFGLADNPAYLEGYGYLDAGQARAIAGDATWQAIIDCASQALERLHNLYYTDGAAGSDSIDGAEDSDAKADTDGKCSAADDRAPDTDSAAGSPSTDSAEYCATATATATATDTDTDTDSDSDAADGVAESTEESGQATESPSIELESDNTPNDSRPEPEAREPDPPDMPERPHPPGPHPGTEAMPEPTPESGLFVFKSRILPGGTIALPARKLPQPGISSPAATIDDLYRTLLTDPRQIRATFPDGHGGFTQPPPGALTYQPSDLLAAATRLRDGTCRHPDCQVPAADCQIDHIVAFYKKHPILGGWTILTNLQCLCLLHHQLKTVGLWRHEMLTGAIMHIYNTIGQHALTLPTRR